MRVGAGGRTACVQASDVPMTRRAALVRMLTPGERTLGEELHTVRGWHFSKSHVRMQPFPFAHKSAITCWQAGRDWPRALRISSPG